MATVDNPLVVLPEVDEVLDVAQSVGCSADV